MSLGEGISTVDICAVLMLNFVELSKVGSFAGIKDTAINPKKSAGSGIRTLRLYLGSLFN